MKEIKTEALIKADIEIVWNTFMDFQAYSTWNPYINKVDGDAVEGKKIRLWVMNKKLRSLKAKITSVQQFKEFKWNKTTIAKWLLNRERIFKFKKVNDNRTLFIHYERIHGIFSIFLSSKYCSGVKEKFIIMNKSLKKYLETPLEADSKQNAA